MRQLRQDENILILADRPNPTIMNRLFNCGWTPFCRREIFSGLKILRRSHFAAVIIDLDGSCEDVLEVLLNIRDFNEFIPIYIIGKINSERVVKALQGQPSTFLINDWHAFFKATRNDEMVVA